MGSQNNFVWIQSQAERRKNKIKHLGEDDLQRNKETISSEALALACHAGSPDAVVISVNEHHSLGKIWQQRAEGVENHAGTTMTQGQPASSDTPRTLGASQTRQRIDMDLSV